MKQIPTKLIDDLQDFVDTSRDLFTDDIGNKVLQERITRLYNSINDPNCHKPNLKSYYKLLAGYAIIGVMREGINKSST